MELILNGYFANHNDELFIGSIIGENLPYNEPFQLNTNLQEGVLLNQKINSFLDNNLNFKNCISKLPPKSRKYKDVIMRLFLDHFLAKKWTDHSEISYLEYCNKLLNTLKSQNHLFSYKSKRVANRLIKNKSIYNLSTINGLNDYILEMSRYNSYNLTIQESIGCLVNNYESFDKDFTLIFNELKISRTVHVEKIAAA